MSASQVFPLISILQLLNRLSFPLSAFQFSAFNVSVVRFQLSVFHSLSSRLVLRCPRGVTVHVAHPTRSIPLSVVRFPLSVLNFSTPPWLSFSGSNGR
jgi:hypothetical protein